MNAIRMISRPIVGANPGSGLLDLVAWSLNATAARIGPKEPAK